MVAETMRFIREPEVQRLTGLSRTTRWRMERQGRFPQRRQLTPRAVGWLVSDIEDWIQSRNSV